MDPVTPSSSDRAPGPLFRHDELDPNRKSVRLLRILPALHPLSTSKASELSKKPRSEKSRRSRREELLQAIMHERENGTAIPNEAMGIIQCTLITVTFDKRIRGAYSALSYEWGPEEPPFYWIRLNSHYLRVRKNLWKFLWVAHSALGSGREIEGFLWVDAICINQDNMSERGHQVKLMGDIYSYARTVLAWLGPSPSKDFEAAVDDILQLDGIVDDMISSNDASINWEYFVDKVENLLRPGSKVFLAFAHICKTTYWTRMWIFQEILSAEKAWLMLGRHWLSWEMVKTVLLRTNILESEVLNSTNMQIVKELSRTHYRNARNRSISETVNAFRHGMCSDSRDRVFAILGLVKSGKEFPATYSNTKEELFCWVIFTSYVSVPSRMGSFRKTGTHAQVCPIPFANFTTTKANLDSLVQISEVSTALGVSFDVLANYLAITPDPAIDALFVFRAWRSATTKLSDDLVEHKYDVLEDKKSRFLKIELTLYVQANGRQWLSFETLCAAIPDPDKPDTMAPTYTIDSTHVEGPVVLGHSSLSVPFAILIFLVGAVHKILNFEEDHLRLIKAQGGCSKSVPGIDGKIYTLLDLSTLSVQQE